MSIPTSASLYQRLLTGYDSMPSALRRFHCEPGNAKGTMEVIWPKGWVRNLFARIMGLPEPGQGLLCTLSVAETKQGEMWHRSIGPTRIVTCQWLAGKDLIEQGGPFRFRFRVEAGETGMTFRQVACTLGPLPFPKMFAPIIQADVHGDEEGWNVLVQISTPTLGCVCRYEGRMVPECK